MNNDLVRPIGESPIENLFNSTEPPALTTGVLISPGQGPLKRGTVLALDADAGECVVLGEPAGGGDAKARYVLADPVDASGSDAAPAVAYRTGHFNRPALIVKDGYAMSRADEESLRDGGIFLSDALA